MGLPIGDFEMDNRKMTELKPLNKKQKMVLDKYLVLFNQWKAYKEAYPNVTDESARSLSSKLFADVNFASHLEARLADAHMSADESLKLLSDIARGDITEFITPFGNIDIDLLRKSGKGRLVKKIKQKTVTKIGKGDTDADVEILETELELYPADSAIINNLKILGKFTDKVDITSNGNTIEPKDDNARFERAISTLADALREIIPRTGDKQNSEVDTSK